MNIVVEKLPKCAASLRVEIPAATVKTHRDKIVNNLAGKARMPGFRPGKAPKAVVEKRFDKQIREDLEETLIREAYDEALEKENLKIIDFGIPQDIVLEDSGFRFTATLTLAPEVTLPEYKGIQVKVPSVDVPSEDLQNQLEELRQRFADFETVEGRGIQSGDFAVIDYTSTVEGQPTDEFLGKSAGYLSGREGFWLKVDEASFLPGFCAKLEGLATGESRDVTVTIPEDFPVADLRGKEITFATSVKEIKTALLPALDDEFAAKLLPGKTLEELTTVIRDNMKSERQKRIDDMKVNQIVEHFNNLVNFELPESLVLQETQSQADAMVQRGIQSGMTEDEIQTQQADLFASAGQQAVVNLKTNFILQEIARVENLAVTDAEVINHLAQVATQRKQQPKKFIRDMSRAGRIPSVRNSIAIGKTIDFLVAQAEVVEVAEPLSTDEE
jgi:trigger factor